MTPVDPAQPGFHAIDWAIVLAYLLIVVAIGLIAAKERREGDDFFLAGRSMPMWAVAISILATAQSAATFVGGPQEAYTGNLTYLATNIGPLIAAVLVGFFFLPRFYQHNVTSVYELVGREMGSGAQRLASGMFMLGRVFASGARLFIVAIPFSLVAFEDIEPAQLALSIVMITVVATLYSMAGGIRAVIWTDVMQVVVYLTCVIIALVLIWQKIPVGLGEIAHALRTDPAGNKLLLLDFSFDLSKPYTVWASLIGITLLMIAAYGADQDLTQRMLTCKSPRKASWSVITATLIGLPVVFIFLAMGMLLYVYFQRPDLMGEAMPAYAIDDSRQVFLNYIINDMPIGLRGLMMAGLFAAAMSSMDSSLNAMSSTTVADFYRPWRLHRDRAYAIGNVVERRVARVASIFWAGMLCGFALVCIWWQQQGGETLIAFALGVMTFAYSGLLGVFFTAMFTRRGNATSAVVAMVTGFVIVLIMDPAVWPQWTKHFGIDTQPAFAWRLTVAATASFIVCAMPRRA
jgi:solute:Na+ symporter, SSS family